MTFFNVKLAEVVRSDPRYAYEAYEFTFEALNHAQELLGRVPPREEATSEAPARAEEPSTAAQPEADYHVSGPELLEGVRQLAVREFGLMAHVVFRMWGVHVTGDFGEIVFNLINAELMSKTPNDNRADFVGVYDFEEALKRDFRIELDEAC